MFTRSSGVSMLDSSLFWSVALYDLFSFVFLFIVGMPWVVRLYEGGIIGGPVVGDYLASLNK